MGKGKRRKSKEWARQNKIFFAVAVTATVCFLMYSLWFMGDTGRQDMQRSVQHEKR